MKLFIELSPHGELRLHFPDSTILAGFSVDIPPTIGGLELLIDTLQRHYEGYRKIGQSGAPTQYQINKMIEEHKKKPKKLMEGVDVSGLDEELGL